MNIKGFNKDLTCSQGGNIKQYAIGEIAEVDGKLECCANGIHYVEVPHHVFNYYSPGTSRFCEVEPLGKIAKQNDDDSKRATNKLKIGAEIDASAICKVSLKAFFEWFKFDDKIKKAKESPDNNAGDYGAANAGNRGAANAGYRGAANAGDCGAANAGDWGAAIVQSNGTASVGQYGVAVCMGNLSKAKGEIGSVLVLTEWYDDKIKNAISKIVDGKTVKANTWYILKNGEFKEAK